MIGSADWAFGSECALGSPCSSWKAKRTAGFSQDERKAEAFSSMSSHLVTTDVCISTALFVWLNEY